MSAGMYTRNEIPEDRTQRKTKNRSVAVLFLLGGIRTSIFFDDLATNYFWNHHEGRIWFRLSLVSGPLTSEEVDVNSTATIFLFLFFFFNKEKLTLAEPEIQKKSMPLLSGNNFFLFKK